MHRSGNPVYWVYCLLDWLENLGIDAAELGDLAKKLRTISTLYDQAARAAASL